MSIDEILKEVSTHSVSHVEITGGEPLLQAETLELIKKLLAANKTVLVETNGSVDISTLPPQVIRIMDIKCPGSGMSQFNLPKNINALRMTDEVKFVIAGRTDFDWAVERIREYDLERRSQLLFSPAAGLVEPSEVAEWLLRSGVTARLQLQLHKILWPNRERGC